MSKGLIARQQPRPFRTSRTVFALMLREMSTTYGRNAFGYLWAVLEPAAGILLLAAVFSFALRGPALGTNFALFYASGFLPFMAYLEISQKTSLALRFSRPLMAFPAVSFVHALLARLVLNSLTQLMVTGIVVTAIITFYRIEVTIDFPVFLGGVFLSFVLAFGVGVLNCFLLSRYPLWERAWVILTRPLFFASCIFFLFEAVPEPFRGYLWYNPLVHVVGMFRKGIYPTYEGGYISVAYVLFFSLFSLLLGLVLLRRFHRDILNN